MNFQKAVIAEKIQNLAQMALNFQAERSNFFGFTLRLIAKWNA
jgi:hypothetical protein